MTDLTSKQLNYSQYLIYGQNQGDNLFGFEFDVHAYTCDYQRCEFVAQERSDDSNCMLILYCKFVCDMTYQQIADYLEEKWLKYIRYQDFEKHYIEVLDTQLHFYYVTYSKAGLGVTGKIVAI